MGNLSGQHLCVQEAVHEELQAALLQRMQALRVGNGFEDATQMGPCINSTRTSHAQVLAHHEGSLPVALTTMQPLIRNQEVQYSDHLN